MGDDTKVTELRTGAGVFSFNAQGAETPAEREGREREEYEKLQTARVEAEQVAAVEQMALEQKVEEGKAQQFRRVNVREVGVADGDDWILMEHSSNIEYVDAEMDRRINSVGRDRKTGQLRFAFDWRYSQPTHEDPAVAAELRRKFGFDTIWESPR